VAMLAFFSSVCQDLTNKGKDFWIGYGNHIRMFNPGTPEKMQLYITSDVNTSGEVRIDGIGFLQPFTVTANQTAIVDIPREAALMDDGLFNHGIHVTAVEPVIVYSFIYVNSISGATVCLPTNTLGNDYYSVNFDQESNEPNASSYFFVIAADTGNTTVEITPSALTKSGHAAGVSYLVSLTQGQVYQVLGAVSGNSGVDLTGSRIRSVNSGSGCKRIAVFCGSGKVAIGCAFRSSDNLYQQMYPTSTWGRKYITVPGMINSNNLFRIVKADPSAKVTLNGTPIADADFVRQFYYQFTSNNPNVIESDKPILVAQYFPTQGCIGNPNPGDPEMIFLNPAEQTINNVTLNSLQPSSGTDINLHFLNVVVKNNANAINSFVIDGQPYKDFIPVPSDNNYAYARITTTKGNHTVTCDTGFNIVAYGFGNAESYGYSGGTHLKDLYQFASIKNEFATIDIPATCQDAPFSFNMTFPYQPTQIEWKFNGLYTDTLVVAPSYDSTWTVNGRKLYLYHLNKIFKGPNAGTYPVKIISHNPTPDGCTGIQEIDYELHVFVRPQSDFTFSSLGCSGDSVYFKDASPASSEPITKWIWDFNNGDSSFSHNATYSFSKGGSYKVAFSYITAIGCISTAVKTVDVNAGAIPDFQTSSPACENRMVTFSDKSTIAQGKIVKWSWTMGDGQEWQKTDNRPFTDSFGKYGVYRVSMQTVTDKGCESMVSRDVAIYPIPVANFVLPLDCSPDPDYLFSDSSKISDGSQSSFRYEWKFGDQNAGTGNPDVSTAKDPTHRYTAAADYQVSLKVTSDYGCTDSLVKVFALHAAAPQLDFTIKEGTSICSDKSITLVNNSGISFGKISNMEIYWNYSNDPTDKTADNNSSHGKTYTKNYPLFYTPQQQQHAIYVVAYSGENCLTSKSQVVTLKAIPEIVFDEVRNHCSNDSSFQLSASILNSLPGTGMFKGDGVSSSGRFNPSAAGAGTHMITYTFKGSEGCNNSLDQQVKVVPIMANAGADKIISDGESILLNGSGTGSQLRYSWSPAASLNNPSLAQPTARPPEDITYTLTATSSEGCSATDAVTIKVLKSPVVPNAFSPNGDGINDTWMIPNLNSYPAASVDVFNRYGQAVFHSKGYGKPWDGTVNGAALPTGTYYYLINPGNGKKEISGSISIIR
jgi:gliding motility-associated-like protein